MNKRNRFSHFNFKALDKYLLVNFPMFWASKLHKAAFYGVFVLIINLLAAYYIPVSFTSLPDPDLVLANFAIIGVILFGIWFFSQKLLMFRVMHARPFRFYFTYTIFTCNLVLCSLIQVQSVPYKILEDRVKSQISDPNLPKLELEDYRYQIGMANYYVSNKKVDTNKVDIFDLLMDFNSDSKNQLSFRHYSSKYKTPYEVAIIILARSNLRLASVLVDSSTHSFKINYILPVKSKSDTVRITKVAYNDYKDTVLKSNLFKQDVFVRKYPTWNKDGKPGKPLEVYFYSSKDQDRYIYTTANAISGSLLIDAALAESRPESLTKQINQIKEYIDDWNGISNTDYTPAIMLVAICLIVPILCFMGVCFDAGYVLTSVFLVGTPFLILTLLFRKLIEIEFYNIHFLWGIIFTAALIVYFTSKSSKPGALKTLSVLVLTLLSTAATSVLAIKVYQLFSKVPFTSHFFISSINEISTVLLGIGTLVLLISSFFASRIYKMSHVPR